MLKASFLHPQYYPLELGLLGISSVALLLFHLLFWAPLSARMKSQEALWQAERPRVVQLERYEKAQRELKTFWEDLPERQAFPAISSSLSDLARQHHLVIPAITYQGDKVPDHDLTRITFAFGVKGAYPDIRAFIAELERSGYFLIIEDLNLLKAGKKVDDPIQLQLRTTVYLRPSAGQSAVPPGRSGGGR
jgi:Tfp pilus assembly protein PilO